MSDVDSADDDPSLVLFGADASLYDQKVEELLKDLKKRYPNNQESFLRGLAEEIASPYALLDPNKRAERPH